MTDSAAELNFETSLEKLEAIVRKLEEGNLGLDDSVRLFEEGMGLFKRCREKLEQAEARIEKIVKEGNAETVVPFAPQASRSGDESGSGL